MPPILLEMGAGIADLPGTMLCGPERAREFARQIEATHVDGLLLNQQFGRTKHEHLMESLEIWATQVIPEFRDRTSSTHLLNRSSFDSSTVALSISLDWQK